MDGKLTKLPMFVKYQHNVERSIAITKVERYKLQRHHYQQHMQSDAICL